MAIKLRRVGENWTVPVQKLPEMRLRFRYPDLGAMKVIQDALAEFTSAARMNVLLTGSILEKARKCFPRCIEAIEGVEYAGETELAFSDARVPLSADVLNALAPYIPVIFDQIFDEFLYTERDEKNSSSSLEEITD